MRLSLPLSMLLILLSWLPAGAAELDLTLIVDEPVGLARTAELVRGGVPLPAGAVTADQLAELQVRDGGTALAAQLTPLARHEDGSVSWLLVEFRADLPASGSKTFKLTRGRGPAAPAAVKASKDGHKVAVDTGAIKATVDAAAASLLTGLTTADGKRPLADVPLLTVTEPGSGQVYTSGVLPADAVEIELAGPLRTVVRVDGTLACKLDGATQAFMDYQVRFTFVAGDSQIGIDASIWQPAGKQAMVAVKDARVQLGLSGQAWDFLALANKAAVSGRLSGNQRLAVRDLGCQMWKKALGAAVRVDDKPISEDDVYTGLVAFNGPAGQVAVYDRWFIRNRQDSRPAFLPGLIAAEKGVVGVEFDDLHRDPGDKSVGKGFETSGAYALLTGQRLFRRVLVRVGSPLEANGLAEWQRRQAGWLHARPRTEQMADCNELEWPLPSWADEQACYDKWGWKLADSKKPTLSAGPLSLEQLSYWMTRVSLDIHYDTETDGPRELAMQYLRLGDRRLLDSAMGVGRYYRERGVWWTSRGPRRAEIQPAADWMLASAKAPYHLNASRFCGCHHYVGGLIDLYLLTGEQGYLDAAREHCSRALGGKLPGVGQGPLTREQWEAFRTSGIWAKPARDLLGSAPTLYGERGVARTLQNMCRFYEVDRDPRAGQWIDATVRSLLTGPIVDERGFIGCPKDPRSLKEQLLNNARAQAQWKKFNGDKPLPAGLFDNGSWQVNILMRAMYRAGQLRPALREQTRDLVIAFARLAAVKHMHPRLEHSPYYVFYDFPRCGDVWFVALDSADNYDRPDPFYSMTYCDLFARAYAETGERWFLERAQFFWDRGSKGLYKTTQRSAGDDEVGRPLWASGIKDSGLEWASFMFHAWANPKSDSQAPAAVGDLKAEPIGGGKVKLTWTAPADGGGSGLAEYQIKHAALPIVDETEYGDDDLGGKRNWWMGSDVSDEPTPGPAGRAESAELSVEPGTRYFAIRSFDAQRNRSKLSNIAAVEVK